MNYEVIRLDQEKKFGEEINKIIFGDTITKILTDSKILNTVNDYSKVFESYHFKITKEMTPKLFKLCNDVKKKLKFKEKIDFFIINSPEMNAFAIPSQSKEYANRIGIHSTIIDKMDDDELRFIVGHEIGHLVCKTYKVNQIMRFIFQQKQPNILLRQKFMFWEKLNELSADRFGLIANENVEKAISSFFKLISGLPKNIIKFNLDKFIKQNKAILESHTNELQAQNNTHPIPALRVISLDNFSKSKLFKSITMNKKTVADKKLATDMDKILQKFYFMGNDMDIHRMHFIASAGIIMAQVDREVSGEEINDIISTLSNYLLFPKEFLDDMIRGKKVDAVFNDSINNLLNPQINRGSIEKEAEIMLTYLVAMVVSDNKILDAELEFLYKIGAELFGFTKERISYMLASVIANNFSPNIM
ncbi:MAG: M48 family metalloprotease [Candidatus Delongbacteria bacterium]|nr:M48 family metalloprotease [Candidatus Delongbacteria bacterium]